MNADRTDYLPEHKWLFYEMFCFNRSHKSRPRAFDNLDYRATNEKGDKYKWPCENCLASLFFVNRARNLQ